MRLSWILVATVFAAAVLMCKYGNPPYETFYPFMTHIPKWGRNPLYNHTDHHGDIECNGNGYLVARNTAFAECDCFVGFEGSMCVTGKTERATFAISYLIYGMENIENTVVESMRKNRKTIAVKFHFVIFYDGVLNASRFKHIKAIANTTLVPVSLVADMSRPCSCAPHNIRDTHCEANDTHYRAMGYFRAVQQFYFQEFYRFTYVIVMDAESYFISGDPFHELLQHNAAFGFYAWGSINYRSCMGNVREWSIQVAKNWGIDTRAFEVKYGTMSLECIEKNHNMPAVCCGVHVSSFSGDVVAFKPSLMRTRAVRQMLRLWSETDMLEYNRSSEQELWPNLFGLLLSKHAIHQFSAQIDIHAHIQYMDAKDIECAPHAQTNLDENAYYSYSYDDTFEHEHVIHRIFKQWTSLTSNRKLDNLLEFLPWPPPPPPRPTPPSLQMMRI